MRYRRRTVGLMPVTLIVLIFLAGASFSNEPSGVIHPVKNTPDPYITANSNVQNQPPARGGDFLYSPKSGDRPPAFDTMYHDGEIREENLPYYGERTSPYTKTRKDINLETEPAYTGSAVWGFAKDIQVVGTYAYCTFGPGLAILDISDPSTPELVSKCYTQVSPEGLTIYGDYAYLAAGCCGIGAMIIIDISNPYMPVIVGTYGEDFAAWNVVIDSMSSPPVAYLCAGDHGLHVVDISDPTNPFQLGHFITGDARDICITGDTAFYIDPGPGVFYILNVADYSNIYTMSYIATDGDPMSLIVKGDYVYLAEETGHLYQPRIEVVDKSDIHNPEIVFTYYDISDESRPWDTKIVDNTLFVSLGQHAAIEVFDISNPEELVFLNTIPGPPPGPYNPDIWNIDIKGGFLFYAGGMPGVWSVDISDIQNPGEAHGFNFGPGPECSSGEAFNVELRDTMVYILNDGAVIPINISDPANPVGLGCDESWGANRFSVQGNYAYVTELSSGIRVTDISDPYNPDFLTWADVPDWSIDVKAVGNLAYVVARAAGLQIVDITDPLNMFVIGSYDNDFSVDNYALVVETYENYALVGDEVGFKVIDVSDPDKPVKVADYYTEFNRFVRRITVHGDRLYLAVAGTWEESMMEIVDFSDPYNPIRIASYYSELICNNAYDIAVHGQYAYIANGLCIGSGLVVVDMSDLSDIHAIGLYDTPRDGVIGVKTDGQCVYLTDYYGFIVLTVELPELCGDVDLGGSVNLTDVTYLIAHLYQGGPPPSNPDMADVNGDNKINILDISHLIQYLYMNGLEPLCH
jgi:hypothetical protein